MPFCLIPVIALFLQARHQPGVPPDSLNRSRRSAEPEHERQHQQDRVEGQARAQRRGALHALQALPPAGLVIRRRRYSRLRRGALPRALCGRRAARTGPGAARRGAAASIVDGG